jgi:hypothetical protein
LLLEELQARAMRYHLIEGSPSERLAQATQLLGG